MGAAAGIYIANYKLTILIFTHIIKFNTRVINEKINELSKKKKENQPSFNY